MQVKVISVAGDVLRIRTEGKIGQNDRPAGEEPIESLLGSDVFSRKVLLSLDGSDLIDSMGVAWLLECHKRFRDAGGMLVIHSIPPLINQVLRIMRLELVFNLAEDETAAQARARGG